MTDESTSMPPPFPSSTEHQSPPAYEILTKGPISYNRVDHELTIMNLLEGWEVVSAQYDTAKTVWYAMLRRPISEARAKEMLTEHLSRFIDQKE